jgi:hypothetical protein
MAPCTKGPNQTLLFTETDNGVRIAFKSSNLPWDIPPIQADGQRVQQFTDHGGTNQRWRVELR